VKKLGKILKIRKDTPKKNGKIVVQKIGNSEKYQKLIKIRKNTSEN